MKRTETRARAGARHVVWSGSANFRERCRRCRAATSASRAVSVACRRFGRCAAWMHRLSKIRYLKLRKRTRSVRAFNARARNSEAFRMEKTSRAMTRTAPAFVPVSGAVDGARTAGSAGTTTTCSSSPAGAADASGDPPPVAAAFAPAGASAASFLPPASSFLLSAADAPPPAPGPAASLSWRQSPSAPGTRAPYRPAARGRGGGASDAAGRPPYRPGPRPPSKTDAKRARLLAHVRASRSSNPPPRVLLLAGLQGSGKSTFASRLSSLGWGVVSQDALGGSRVRCESLAARLLSRGQAVVIDRCNFDRAQRDVWLQLARAAGAQVGVVVFAVPVEECVRRVQSREGHTGLPPGEEVDGIVRRTARLFRMPKRGEGFRFCRVVRGEDDAERVLKEIAGEEEGVGPTAAAEADVAA